MDTNRSVKAGFTLIELLVVVALLGVLAALLFPVFEAAREKGRSSACLSNERQLGLAILQYVQDNDETFPNGIQRPQAGWIWQGEGWIGQCDGYIKSANLARCPSDLTESAPMDLPVSYGYNINFILPPETGSRSGRQLSQVTAPAKSVLLFEVSSVTANLTEPGEGAWSGTVGTNFSPSGNGLDNRLYAQMTDMTSFLNQYATGYLGGRFPPNPAQTQFESATGRHFDGSNYVLGDGHARWIRGENVSSGIQALYPECAQDNLPATFACHGAPDSLYAAGTESGVTATFSTK